MNRIFKPSIFTILILLTCLTLNACGAGKTDPTPTLSAGSIQTIAVRDYLLGLTQTAIYLPTNTPTLTPTSTRTATPTSGTPVTPGSGLTPTSSCYGLVLIRDVTIPDNTPMVAGQTFVKTWLVKNTGTCAWEAGFRFVFTGGDAMGGSALVLDRNVGSGAEIELSVSMTAPIKTGPVQGFWRMSTKTGTMFGNEVFVLINIGTGTPTMTVTATPTPTETPSPEG